MSDDNNENEPERTGKGDGQSQRRPFKALEQSARERDPIVDGMDQLLGELQDFALDHFVEARRETFDLRREELLKFGITLTNAFGTLASKRAMHIKTMRRV